MTSIRSGSLALVALLLTSPALAAAAPPAGAPAGTQGGTVHHVHMQGTSFSPAELTVAAGDTIEWHNHDAFGHTATDDGAAWDTGDVPGGSTASLTFEADATYGYSCVYHAGFGMVGSLEVGAGGGGNEAPTVAITAPGDGATVEGTVTVEGTASDADGTVAQVEVRVDGGAWQAAQGTTSWSFAWDTAAVEDGSHTLEARATDDADAVSAVQSRQVQVANPPTVAITSPADGAEVQGMVTVEGTASDPGPGGSVAQVEVRVDGGAWQAAEGTTSWSFTWDSSAVADGAHTLEARSQDAGDLVSGAASVEVSVANGGGNVRPTVAIAAPGEGADVEGTVTVEGTADDADGTVAQVEVRVDGGAWQAAEGTTSWTFAWDADAAGDGARTIEARSTDDAGDTSTLASLQVTVATRPVVAITAPAADGAEVQGAVQVEGTAEDAGGNLDAVEVRVDGGAWQAAEGTSSWSFAWDTTGVDDGTHTVEARARDGAGNEGEAAAVEVVVANPPTIGITSPADGAEVQGTVTVRGAAGDPGPNGAVSRVEVRVDGGPWEAAEGTSSWSFAWDTTTTDDGVRTIEARATDAAGHTAMAARSVQVANPPTVAISAPVGGAELQGTVTIEGTASDPGPNGAVRRVEVRVDGGPWEAAEGATSWSFAWDTTSVDDGTRTVEARSEDTGGLRSTVASRSFVVDNLRPDLVVRGIAVEGTLTFVLLTATVANEGDEASPATQVAFTYQGAGPDEAPLGTLEAPALAPGEAEEVTLRWDHLGKLGRFQVRATADAAGEVREHVEDNNDATTEVCLPHLGGAGVGCLLPPTEVL